MAKTTEKETRIMKVTMDKEDFKKLDRGELHSDSGIRDGKGRLRSLPDVVSISEDDLPQKEVVRVETVYLESEEQSASSIAESLASFIIGFIEDVLSDPEVQELFVHLGKSAWRKGKGLFKIGLQRIKQQRFLRPKAIDLVSDSSKSTTYELELVSDSHKSFALSQDEYDLLIGRLRKDAQEISAIIFLLSNSYVKNRKTAAEFELEQGYIKYLMSEEATNTMKLLNANKQHLDSDCAICISDFLNGYIQVNNEKVRMPMEIGCSSSEG